LAPNAKASILTKPRKREMVKIKIYTRIQLNDSLFLRNLKKINQVVEAMVFLKQRKFIKAWAVDKVRKIIITINVIETETKFRYNIRILQILQGVLTALLHFQHYTGNLTSTKL
jgi:hypothetical protein